MKLLILTVLISLATILVLLASHGTSANGEWLRQLSLFLSSFALVAAIAQIVRKIRESRETDQ